MENKVEQHKLETQVKKLERKNKELKKDLSKSQKNSEILTTENKKLQEAIKKFTQILTDLGEEALIPVLTL